MLESENAEGANDDNLEGTLIGSGYLPMLLSENGFFSL
jgi:hypothetical protein